MTHGHICLHAELSADRLLPFPLIAKLVEDAWENTWHFIGIKKDRDFAFAVTQFLTLHFQFITCSICHGHRFVLN